MCKLSFLFNAEDTLLYIRKWYSKKMNFLQFFHLFIFVSGFRKVKIKLNHSKHAGS